MQLPETSKKLVSPPNISLSITVLSYDQEQAAQFVEEILQARGKTFNIGAQTVSLIVRARDLNDLIIKKMKISQDSEEESRVLEQNGTLFQAGEVLIFLQSKDELRESERLTDFLEHLSSHLDWFGRTSKPTIYLFAKPIFFAKVTQSYELKSENKELIKIILEEEVQKKIKHLINVGDGIITRALKNVAGLKQLDFYNTPSFVDLIGVIAIALAHRDNSDIESLNVKESSLAKHTPYPGYFHALQPVTDFCYALQKGNFQNLRELLLDGNGLKTVHLQEILSALIPILKYQSLRKLSLTKNNLDDGAIDVLISLLRSGKCTDDFVLELNSNPITEAGKMKLASIYEPPNGKILKPNNK